MNDNARLVLATVSRLLWPDTTDLSCAPHPPDHTCPRWPDGTDASDVSAVTEALSMRHGDPALATTAALTGLPPADGTARRHEWAFSDRWIASGRTEEATRPWPWCGAPYAPSAASRRTPPGWSA
ncbi:hypothetical protein [Streptomyces thermolilacinus]|uniref:Uncharacterized protein n=1 Tax=Streptomyces thermolilacinus SPC6 TaxID=1306406 RepID=A0A1D3DLJ3_9ACTN|nr:hypothetical protein [Streptomyces thermolilacinus]OEJ93197.1 hypothetical protein J116_000545 [Streptomyces thermolilacinus SPC6]